MKRFKLNLHFEENPLKIKNFRFFIVGHFISFTGTWMQNTAQIWLVYEMTLSAFYLGIFNFLNSFPTFILTLISGILTDLLNRKKMLSIITFLSIIPPLILGFLTQFNLINFWYVTFLAGLSNCLSALDVPLRNVFISEIVPIKFLTQAISFQSISFHTARLLGPFLTGLIVSYRNLYECFYLNALSFIFFFIFLVFFIKEETPKKTLRDKGKSIKESIKEVYEFIKKEKDKSIMTVILSSASFTLFGASVTVALPVIVHKFYGGESKEYAFLSSILGLGAVFGAFTVIFRKIVEDKIKHLFKASLALALGLLGLSFIKNWYFTLICCFGIGFSFTNFFPIANSYLQENTPDYLRGRIISLFILVFSGINPLGNLIAGFLTDKISLQLVLLFYSIILASVNSYLLVFKFKK